MVLDSLLMLHVMFKGLATAGVTRAVTVSLSIAAGLCRLFMTVFLGPHSAIPVFVTAANLLLTFDPKSHYERDAGKRAHADSCHFDHGARMAHSPAHEVLLKNETVN